MGAAKEVQAPKMRQSQGLAQLLVLESAEAVAGRKARYAGGRHSRQQAHVTDTTVVHAGTATGHEDALTSHTLLDGGAAWGR